MTADGPLRRGTDPKIACRRIWKLYGPNSRAFLESQGRAPSAAALAEHGYVAAVRDATLAVTPGETFVIMGLSGSGKSTLVRCLSRLVEPTAGNVRFDGQDLLSLPERQLIEIRRHKMAMVFQHFALLPHETVLGNVAFPLEIQGVERRARERRALEMIELVGLKNRENYYPRELSGGQQQRVGIARALAIDPEVLFLDEPFSALDPLIRREMQDELMRLQGTLRKTIIFITHDFEEALRLADRMAIMQDGAIIQVGTPEELVIQPASGYVQAFTRNVSRAKVLSVRAIMQPLASQEASGIRVGASTKIEAAAPRMVEANADAIVVDEAGRAIGQLAREAVFKALADRA